MITVRRVARRYGLKEVGEDEDWNIYWTDTSVGLERVMEMKRYQVISYAALEVTISIYSLENQSFSWNE